MDMPANQLLLPEIVPSLPPAWPAADTDPATSCTIVADGRHSLTLWSWPKSCRRTATEVQLQLAPDAPVIIGRSQGGEIPYLDPSYTPTPIIPGTGKTILRHDGSDEDMYVSRGHFMLRAHPHGILLVNGVSRRGGGVRPPLNGTHLLAPHNRPLGPGEELLIEHGSQVSIRLPNETRLTIQAQ